MLNENPTTGRIVVGIDGSEGAWRALEWAVKEAKLRAARLEAVHAWHFPFREGPGLVPGLKFAPDAVETLEREELDRIVDSVDASGLVCPIERRLVFDGTASALLEAARGAELLVVGSRGLGGFAGLLLGSVSQAVAHHATCPVVIVPTDQR